MSKNKDDWKYAPLGWMLAAIARLPFRALYLLSDILYVMVYHVVRYRRKVVMKNLVNSFPEKSRKELRDIMRQFYRNFSDYFFETIKLGHVTDEEIKTRMEFVGLEQLDECISRGESIGIYFSHCGNWEWAPSMTLWMKHHASDRVKFCQVYRRLKNDWFNDYFLRLRSRFGSLSFEKRTVFRDLFRINRSGAVSITGFMSDQKPSHNDTIHVVKFLNQPTAIITGTETIIRKLGMKAYYWDMEKLSRGHYRITVRLISADPSAEPEFAITDAYARMLETTIRRSPSIWLWTHKRWKHKVDYSDNEQSGKQ